MKWVALTLALPVFFAELFTHGLRDDGALLGLVGIDGVLAGISSTVKGREKRFLRAI